MLAASDGDIPDECAAVRAFLRESGACFFDDIVAGTGIDWRLVLRAIWHLVWTGEATNDSYESIRHADVKSGLSACYDLASHPGKVFTRETLLSRVWGYDYYGGARTVDVHVRRLRSKLGEEHAGLIQTVRSVGYRFGQSRWG